MKLFYHSLADFEKNCPCNYYLTAYAESVSPASADVKFFKGHKSPEGNTYVAEYTVVTKPGQGYCKLEVSCTQLPDRTYSYSTINKTDIP